MKNELMIFENEEFGKVGMIEIDGKPYFVANDIARAPGYASPKNAISRHCKGALKRCYLTEGGEQEVKIIPEGDMYRLIIRSKLETAQRFEKWVMDDIPPSIRKTGSYSVHKESAPDYSDTAPKGLLWFLQLDSKDRMDALAFMQTASSYMTSVQKEAGAYNPEVKATSSQPTVSAASDFKAKSYGTG